MNTEDEKIYKFILKNKDTIFKSKKLNAKDKRRLVYYIKYKHSYLSLPLRVHDALIDAFVNNECVFTNDTPNYLLENKICIRASIKRNIDSLKYINIKSLNSELKNYIIKEAIRQNYILNKESPTFLKKSFPICFNSIKANIKNVDCINWQNFSNDAIKELINYVINSNYKLNPSSPIFLRECKEVILSSIKKDPTTAQYASYKMLTNNEIFNYLLDKNYQFPSDVVLSMPLNTFINYNTMYKLLDSINLYGNIDNPIFKNNFVKLLNDSININPTIKKLGNLYDYALEKEWLKYKNENDKLYDNIFGIICAELRNSDSLLTAISNLKFIPLMKKILNDKYNKLYSAMETYFNIYHSKESNKLNKLEPYRDIIANLANEYIIKSKAAFKKDELDDFYDNIKEFFIIRKDNPLVIKKTIINRKKELFKDLYINNDISTCKYIESLFQKYSNDIGINLFYKYVNGFIVNGYKDIIEFGGVPLGYNQYIRYLKAKKLINRLNSGYIKYEDKEIFNYQDIIKYDDKNKKYYYFGKEFFNEDILVYKEYLKLSNVFEKIKKDIFTKIKSLEANLEDDEDIYLKLKYELPFNDDYFIFNREYFLNELDLNNLLEDFIGNKNYKEINFTNTEAFNNMYNLLINNNMWWLFLIRKRVFLSNLNYYSMVDEIINNIYKITSFANSFNFDLNQINDLMCIYDIYRYADNKSLAILGQDIIESLCKNDEYTTANPSKIITMAVDLVCQMIKNNKRTVPYISGKTLNYKYTTYDTLDLDILLAGIKTDACFRIDGNDNDFLHYAAINKNGFVIKITDIYGNFIGRAAGFRNGNCVFINQLRTIYDEGGCSYKGNYENEKKEIIATFKKACLDILKASWQNPLEKIKIEHVFVNKSYILEEYNSEVSDKVSDKIGLHPMDSGRDWIKFVKNTKNLYEAESGYFETDYGAYPIICMASIKNICELKPDDLDYFDTDIKPLYERKRNSIKVVKNIDNEVIAQINRLKAIKCYYDKSEFRIIDIPRNSIIFMGDNWYIVYNNDIINSCLLDFDNHAKEEYTIVYNIIREYSNNLNNYFNEVNDKVKTLIYKKDIYC